MCFTFFITLSFPSFFSFPPFIVYFIIYFFCLIYLGPQTFIICPPPPPLSHTHTNTKLSCFILEPRIFFSLFAFTLCLPIYDVTVLCLFVFLSVSLWPRNFFFDRMRVNVVFLRQKKTLSIYIFVPLT
jgi:hypothetical protein